LPTGATPRVAKRSRTAGVAMATPAVRERFATLGVAPVGNQPEQFATFIREDFARWTKVVKDGNIKVE